MKNFILIVTFLIFAYQSQSQITGYEAKGTDTTQAKVDPNVNQHVNMKIDQSEASFPGGNDSLFRHIFTKLTYSEEAIEDNVTGEILISFNVNFDGKVRDISILQGVGYGIDEKVSQIIKDLIFIPARMNNTAFRSQVFYTIPINARSKIK